MIQQLGLHISGTLILRVQVIYVLGLFLVGKHRKKVFHSFLHSFYTLFIYILLHSSHSLHPYYSFIYSLPSIKKSVNSLFAHFLHSFYIIYTFFDIQLQSMQLITHFIKSFHFYNVLIYNDY